MVDLGLGTMGVTWTLAWTSRAKVTPFSELIIKSSQLTHSSLVYDATLAHPTSVNASV